MLFFHFFPYEKCDIKCRNRPFISRYLEIKGQFMGCICHDLSKFMFSQITPKLGDITYKICIHTCKMILGFQKEHILLRWKYHYLRYCHQLSFQIEGKGRKYQGIFNLKSRNNHGKFGKTSFNIRRISKSQNGTNPSVRGISGSCWHTIPFSNALLKSLANQ